MFRLATTITTMLFVTAACAILLAAAPPETRARNADPPASAASTANQAAPPRMVAARPSIDALVDDLVTALSKDDKLELQLLRVSEEEYRDLIIPGTVEPGKPLRQNSEKVKEFFWQMLDGKSRYYGDDLLMRFKGRTYKRKAVRFTAPTQHYASYDAHGELRVDLEDELGKNWELEAGYIVEMAGEFKFMSYEHD